MEVEGLELPPGVALGCAEEIARADASAGWCVSIAITSSLLAAHLSSGGRDEMFGDGQAIAAGVWAPRGRARRGAEGVIVSGRWAFCSGITHADLLFAGCMVEGDARPSVVALRKQDLEILDTWHTLGLRGTGSHDAVADDVFVPEASVFSLFDGPVLDRPLYRFPIFGFFALSIGAAALGNASRRDRRSRRAGQREGGPGFEPHARRARDRRSGAVATAEASLRAARALYYETIEAAWQAAQHRRAGLGPPSATSFVGRHPRGASVGRDRAFDVRPGRRHRDLRRRPAPATFPRRAHRHRALPGQRGVPGAARPDPARSAADSTTL